MFSWNTSRSLLVSWKTGVFEHYPIGSSNKIHRISKMYVLEVSFLMLETGYFWIKALEFHIKWVAFFAIERKVLKLKFFRFLELFMMAVFKHSHKQKKIV